MKKAINRRMSIGELGALVCSALDEAGIQVFLSGGAVVSIYTRNKYQSYDLDFVSIADRKRIKEVMLELGFSQSKSRMFDHPATDFTVEFPGAAVLVGDQPIRKFSKLKMKTGTLRLLTPTDCVKDRLAAYFHWNDRQGLNQAVAVTRARVVKLSEVKAWAERERMSRKYQDYLDALKRHSRVSK